MSNGDKQHPHYLLLVVGVVLLLTPLVFIVISPDQFEQAGFFLRIIAALGGGLIGAFIPGMLDVELPFAKAGGALAVFLVIYGTNPPRIVEQAFASLEKDANAWVVVAQEARKSGVISPNRPLPVEITHSRSVFESSWTNAGISEQKKLAPKLAYEALSLTSRVYRVQEIQSETKHSAQKWSDIAINYFEATNNTKYLVESLLDKAAIFLEISQIEHTEPEEWQEAARNGDEILARAFSLAAPDQESDTLRIWSRFFYNLSRPKSGNLTKNWDNNYLLIALDKIEQAYELDSENLKNATQLARTIQKAAANPPQDSDPAWTKKMSDVQRKLLKTWSANQEKLKTPTSRIPALNIIGVLTLNTVHRTWELEMETGVIEKAKQLSMELENVAIKAQREALTLLPHTEWQEDYDFDMYYDLARMQAVKCRIMKNAALANSEPECKEALKNMKIAKRKASSIQLNSARQAMESDPTLNTVPQPYRGKLTSLLESSEV